VRQYEYLTLFFRTNIYHQTAIQGKATQPTKICTQQEDLKKNEGNVK
jgi:hypothetical protein